MGWLYRDKGGGKFAGGVPGVLFVGKMSGRKCPGKISGKNVYDTQLALLGCGEANFCGGGAWGIFRWENVWQEMSWESIWEKYLTLNWLYRGGGGICGVPGELFVGKNVRREMSGDNFWGKYLWHSAGFIGVKGRGQICGSAWGIVCGGKSTAGNVTGDFPGNIWGTSGDVKITMQDWRSPRAAVMISATLVNRQTDRHIVREAFDWLYIISSASRAKKQMFFDIWAYYYALKRKSIF